MKDSKDYSQKVRRLYRSLKQKCAKGKNVEYDDPVDALVHGIVSEKTNLSSARMILKRMKGHFVDLNDVRVCRTEEILDVLGSTSSESKSMVVVLQQALNSIFNKYDMVNLSELNEMGKRQAHGVLEKLDGVSRFACSYCFLTALGGHSIPLTSKMLEYLRANELVHPDANEEDIAGFLERQVNSSDAYRFYSVLRRQSETKSKRVPKKSGAKKTVKKTKKK